MKMNIRLKIMDQTDHPFEVDDQTLLSDFRLQVAERLHIPPDRQRMIFAGHVLKNENSTLSACGLRDGHVVHLVERPADMPFPPTDGEANDGNGHSHHHHHHQQHGRFFPNMFGPQTNQRELLTYAVPFERRGILSENTRIEELVRTAINNIPYLTTAQRARFDVHWSSPDSLHIALRSQTNPFIASPALERVILITTILDQIAHFRSIVEAEAGLASRIDEFLEGSHVYNLENTDVMNEQVRAVGLMLERDPLPRSRLVDTVGSEEAGEDESDEHAARYQCVAEGEGNPGYVMRHAITQDLIDILRRLQREQDALRPHLLRYERILNCRILYNIDDAEHTDTDYRANFFTVYMEHVQRTVHRLSHAWHLTSDLSVYLHTPMPRRLLPNYQQFQLLPLTEAEIVLDFHPQESGSTGEATTSESSWRFLGFPPAGVDVQELTDQEVRILGMNPTIRRMQQMGIAVPLPIQAVSQVNIPAPAPSGHHRMVAPRRFVPPRRNGTVSSWNRQQPSPGSGVQLAPSNRGDAARPLSVGVQEDSERSSWSSPGGVSNRFAASASGQSRSSLEEFLLVALEGGVPSEDSNNPYERFVRLLLQSTDEPSVDIAHVLHSSAVQQAFRQGMSRVENGNITSSRQTPHPTQRNSPSSISSLGTIARGVITQSGGEVPFMSEVISNLMRSNGMGRGIPPQYDVIVEYGETAQPDALHEHQGQPHLINMGVAGIPDEHGRQPAAIGYHVEVHQFDIFRQPDQEASTLDDSRNEQSSGVPASSSSTSAPSNSSVVGPPQPVGSALSQIRQRQRGAPGDFPFLMGGIAIPPEMQFMAQRQDIVNVDPFLMCTSRFTDVQRVLRNSHPNISSQLSPYRRFMGDALLSSSIMDRRLAPVDEYDRVMLDLTASGNVVMTDERMFETFIQLAVRSALSRMIHTDQDRNSQNARGSSTRIFPGGASVQIPGGAEIVQASVSAPVLVHAEIDQHSHVHSEPTRVSNRQATDTSVPSNDTSNDQQYDFIPRDEEGRSILMEMASTMSVGLDTRLASILSSSHAPPSLLHPGNGAGVLAHLEALLLNFVTLGDLANMINVNMTPLELHRSRFRAHVIENQLDGNSTPSSEDLLSASARLAALRSSIASVICAAGGELERDWNGRRMNISATIHNVEVATIQQLLRALLDRSISDAEFSHRVQNALRDYVRHLVALGNHAFVNADQSAYVRIVYEILTRAGRTVGNVDANLTRLLHLRNCLLPRVAALVREQGRFPNLDEIPSRLLVWAVLDEGELLQDSTDVSQLSSRGAPQNAAAANDEEDNLDETRYPGAHSSGPTPAKKRKLEDRKTEPSTSRGFASMPQNSQAAMGGGVSDGYSAERGAFDGSWQQSFPEWAETIEGDVLSGVTNPRRPRNPSDIYQSAHPEQTRRVMVSDGASEDDVVMTALRESVDSAFRGTVPANVQAHLNSYATTDAFNELIELAILRRIEEDVDFDPDNYPNVARRFTRRY